jgi:hypothetical protein
MGADAAPDETWTGPRRRPRKTVRFPPKVRRPLAVTESDTGDFKNIFSFFEFILKKPSSSAKV